MPSWMERNIESLCRTDGIAASLPEHPTEAHAPGIWSLLTLVMRKRMIWINKADCIRLAGTAGEPTPHFQDTVVIELGWKDHVLRGKEKEFVWRLYTLLANTSGSTVSPC